MNWCKIIGHKWSKWITTEIKNEYSPEFPKIPYYIQEKTCLRCGMLKKRIE